jgi:hypothetical protein
MADRKPLVRYSAMKARSLAACSAELHHATGRDPIYEPGSAISALLLRHTTPVHNGFRIGSLGAAVYPKKRVNTSKLSLAIRLRNGAVALPSQT